MQNCIHQKDNSSKSVNHCLTLKERPKVKSDHNTTRFEACLFVYLGFNVTFNTVQVISRRVVGRAEETST